MIGVLITMKTTQEVYMDFRTAQEVVRELRTIARDTRHVSNSDLQRTLSQVRNSWQGENADAFLAKGKTLQNKIELTAQTIEDIAKTIEQIARNTYNSEMEAIRQAKKK